MKNFSESELDKMQDSEFLAYVLAHLFQNQDSNFVSDVIFNRIEKILQTMSKEEML